MTIYGETAQGLASTENISVQEAQDIIDKLMKAYPQLAQAIEKAKNDAKQKGYVETISGFRRRLDVVRSNDKSKASRALRQSFNAVVQGSGAYCTNTALIALRKAFIEHNFKSELVLTVHDSVVIDVYPTELEEVAKVAKYCFGHLDIPELQNIPVGNLDVPDEYKMSPATFRYPLVGEVEIGLNYNDDVDYNQEDYKKFSSPTGYCKYMYAKLQLSELKGLYKNDEAKVKAIEHQEQSLESQKQAYEKI